VYYGVSYGSVDLGWDPYLTFALTSLVEIPAVYLAVYSAEKYVSLLLLLSLPLCMNDIT
jgi:hypothetical protein